MSHSRNRELNDWLNRHGYRHSQAGARETPYPYALAPHMARELMHEKAREDHARIIHQEPTGRPVFAAHERNHHITTSGRRALQRHQFALPPGPEEKRRGIKGRLPIDTLERARSALSRASMMHHHGDITMRQLAQARRAVHREWPMIQVEGT